MTERQPRIHPGVPSAGQWATAPRAEPDLGLGDLVDDPVLTGDPPLVEHDTVTHVGTLDAADRDSHSHEGDGLSVSLHPDEWSQIAHLGARTAWRIERPDHAPLRFVAWHDLDETTRDRVRHWAADRGWVAQRPMVRATWTGMDDNGQDARWSFEADTEAEAAAEAEAHEGEDVSIESVHCWRATADFPDSRIHRDLDPTDVLLSAYIREHRPDLDGVWWEDEYAPELLSCPRGVLVHDLDRYEVRRG